MGSPRADNTAASAIPIETSLPIEKRENASFEVSLLGLSGIPGLGRKGITALVEAYEDDLGLVWREPLERLQAVLSKHKIPSSEAIAKEVRANAEERIDEGESKLSELAQNRVSVVPPAKIPPKLKLIPHPPRWLFVQGTVESLYRTPFVAVVGTRQPSERGRWATQLVVRHLSAYPLTLISGLAEGIDEEAHRASLQEGVKNVAFLGHGINLYFPASTKTLRKRIVQEGGAVVSEYLPDEHYKKSYFIERNRLQAALADLVIPVEARPKGGTAHTVRFSRSYGRPLIGIKWDNANGILAELESENYPILSIFTSPGKRQLDEMMRHLARQYGHRTTALALVERTLQRELQSRNVKRVDLERLLERITEELEEDFDEDLDQRYGA